MDKKINRPKKGAARKWAQRLKELGNQAPPEELMKKINKIDENKKVARDINFESDMDV